MTFTLRTYQAEAVEAVYDHLRTRDDNPCVVLPTGTGKSLVIAQIVTDSIKRWGGRVIVLAHVKELLEQNAQKIRALCPDLDVGVHSAGLNRRDTDHAVIVAGIQSVYTKACHIGACDLIIVDEAHLIPLEGDGMYRQFLSDMRVINPLVRVVGLTATPFRLRGGMVCRPDTILNKICYDAGLKEMIDEGWLSPLRSKAGMAQADLSSVHIRGGEFIEWEMQQAMDHDDLVEAACAEILQLTADRHHVLIFTAGVDHCSHVATTLARLSGQEIGVIVGGTPPVERAETIERFKGGSLLKPLKFLVNVNVLTTGFDAECIDCVVLLRPTASPGLYVQMVGRGTRKHPDKQDCLILDYGENVLRHGPVDSIKVKGDSVKTGKGAVKACVECREIIAAGCKVCEFCGAEQPFEEQPKHAATAGTESILSETVYTTWPVLSVGYSVHHSKNKPDNPPSMKVTYDIGLLRRPICEWVCPEHGGYATEKFRGWWSIRSFAPIPTSTQDAVDMAQSGALARPLEINVKQTGNDWPQVVSVKLDEAPDWEPDPVEDDDVFAKSYSLEDCPF